MPYRSWKNYVIDNAQNIVDAGEDRTALQRKLQQLQEEKQQLKETVDKLGARLAQLSQALEQSTASTKAYADSKANQAEKAAKAYADGKANQAEKAAKAYADGKANQAKKAAINAQTTANNAVSKANLKGAIGFFASINCPSGWKENTATRGRYIVGLNPGGKIAATVGQQLSNQENRAVGNHSHSYTYADVGHKNPNAFAGVGGAYWKKSASIRFYSKTRGTAGTNTPAGTNAPYIQYKVCEKL